MFTQSYTILQNDKGNRLPSLTGSTSFAVAPLRVVAGLSEPFPLEELRDVAEHIL